MKYQNLELFYEEAVSSIASGIGIQEFAELCYDHFHLDIIVVDEGYSLLGCAGSRPFADPYWETLAAAGSPLEETIVDSYLKAGYLEAISEAENAIFVNWGVCRDYPQTSAPIYVNKQLVGFISLLFLDMEKRTFL